MNWVFNFGKSEFGWFQLLTLAPFGKESVAANNNFNSLAIANVARAIESVNGNDDEDDCDFNDDGDKASF